METTTIFSGYKLNYTQFQKILDFKILNQTIFETIKLDNDFYIGKCLVKSYSHSHCFSIEDIREFSINDEVREVRRILLLTLPEFTNVHPQLFLIKKEKEKGNEN